MACVECNYAQGDECILYSGDTYINCDLVQNTWYQIDDLISKLACAAAQGTTTSTTTTTTTTLVATVSVSDASATNATLVFQPGDYISNPGSGSTINLPYGTYALSIVNTTLSGKFLEFKDGPGGTGNIVSDDPIAPTQPVTIPDVLTIRIHV